LLSLWYLPVALSEPGPGFPQFLSMGSLDGIPFQRRRSQRGLVEPHLPGMAAGAEPGYWDGQSRNSKRHRHGATRELQMLQERHSQSGAQGGEPGLGELPSPGLHTLQEVSGCDLLSQGNIHRSNRLSSNRREFLSFQLGFRGSVVADSAAQVTKRRWEHDEIEAEELTNHLGHTCLGCLRKCVRYGREALECK
ncbi:HA1F protein, partial [Acrocephalus arundinaceus]|nr:HA1F protein [Acrocephalus arundinaceus]